jgi:Flp pilus assembly protein TadB
MNSERQKREQEIERLVQGASLSREARVAFQEELRKTASAIFEEETRKLQKAEPVERPRRSVNPATAGLWLVVLGVAGFVFSMPGLGGVLLVCGIAAIAWDTVPKLFIKKRRSVKSFRASSKNDSS